MAIETPCRRSCGADGVDSALHMRLRADADSDEQYERALERFRHVAAQRKRRWEQQRETAATTSDGEAESKGGEHAPCHLTVLSVTEEPWRVFAVAEPSLTRLEQRLATQRLVYEWSSTHVSALHHACAAGDRRTVRLLLSDRAEYERQGRFRPCPLARDACGRTPLHYAALHEQHKVVRALLARPDAALQARARDNAGDTSTHVVLRKLAALGRRTSVSGSTSPSAKTPVALRSTSKRYRRLWRTADHLMLAARTRGDITGDDFDASLLALDMRCRGDAWDAVQTGDVARLAFLLRDGDGATATPSRSLPELHHLKRSLLHDACDFAQVSVVNYLLTHCDAPAHALDSSGCTPLHYAAMRGVLETCIALLEAAHAGDSVDSDIRDSRATAAVDTEALCLCQDARGRTSLHWSLLSRALDSSAVVATYLASKCASALHVRDADGFTPLHTAIWRGDLSVVRKFVELGASVSAVPRRSQRSTSETCASRVTAPWAPCGARFQTSKTAKTPMSEGRAQRQQETRAVSHGKMPIAMAASDSAAATAAPVPNHLGVPVRPKRTMKCAHESESYNSDVLDTLWYWIRKPERTRTSDASQSSAEAEAEGAPGNKESTETTPESLETPLGCSKYGSVCRKCAPESEYQEEGDPVDPLSPLALAIRMCRRGPATLRTAAAVSTRERTPRWRIVEYLLVSGADPSGDSDSAAKTPLEEALAVAPSCPQVLALLLEFGAKRIRTRVIEQLCVSGVSWQAAAGCTAPRASTTHATGVTESAVTTVVRSAELVGTSGELAALATVLFATRCFNALLLLSDPQPRDSSEHRHGDPAWLWDAVRRGLTASGPRALGSLVDREHLWFLAQSLHHRQTRHHSTHALAALLHECLNACFAKWRLESKRSIVSAHEHQARRDIVARCLELLLAAHLPHCDCRDTRLSAVAKYTSVWTDYCIALSMFDCALVLIDAQLASGSAPDVSLDRLLCVLDSDVLSNRHAACTDAALLPELHRSFVLALLDKCTAVEQMALAPMDEAQSDNGRASTAARQTHRSAHAGTSVSGTSVVLVCAYDLPRDAVHRVLALATFASPAPLDCKHRVRGKTIAQWLVLHERQDLMALLLERDQALAHSMSAGSGSEQQQQRSTLWRSLVSALVAAPPTARMRELLEWLVSLHSTPPAPSRENIAVAGDERLTGCHTVQDDVLAWLLCDRAVRCDSFVLFQVVMARLWRSSSAPAPPAGASKSEQDDKISPHCSSQTLASLAAMGVFAALARWNALSLAQHIFETYASASSSFWREVLLHPPHAVECDSRPLELCYALGHVQLAALFRRATDLPHAGESTADWMETTDTCVAVPELHAYGRFQTIMRLNAQRAATVAAATAPDTPPQQQLCSHCTRTRTALLQQGVFATNRGWWTTACTLNLVTHLDALALHRVPVASPRSRFELLHNAITSGSLDALQWLLLDSSASLSRDGHSDLDSQAILQLYDAASKHTSDRYAHMTLLLLAHVPYPGRLAGDGTDTTLLHQCVRFANPALARAALDRVLAIHGSSVDVLDDYGHAPVVHAVVSGQLANVCTLLRFHHARLEAEYEGQSCFYYTLQLAPSFAWRYVLERLLRVTCARRSLHCTGGSRDTESMQAGDGATACGCKGFEHPADSVRDETSAAMRDSAACGFCGHAAASHSKVPFPPWLLDQYETYVKSKALPREDTRESDASDDEDSRDRAAANQASSPTSDAIEDAALEDRRGRLDAAALTVIARLRFAKTLEEHGLLCALDDALGVDGTSQRPLTREALDSLDTLPVVESESSAWSMLPLQCLDDASCLLQDSPAQAHLGATTSADASSESPSVRPTDDMEPPNSSIQTAHLPWHLRADAQALHPRSCRCQARTFATTRAAWTLQVVSQWLAHVAERASDRCVSASLRPSAPRSCPTVPLHRVQASQPSSWPVRLALTRWRRQTLLEQTSARTQRRLADLARASTRVTVRSLQQFVSHWRFARAFAAFQRWKHASASVCFGRLESAVDAIVAHMRTARLALLRAKQQALETAAECVALGSEGAHHGFAHRADAVP